MVRPCILHHSALGSRSTTALHTFRLQTWQCLQGLQRLLESPEIQHLFKQGMQGQLAEVEAGRLNNLPVVGAVNAFARAPMRQVCPACAHDLLAWVVLCGG